MNRIVFIGTDAGGFYFGKDGKIHRFPGWNPEQMTDVAHALAGLRDLAQIKAPGVAERAYAVIHEFVGKELGQHLEQGDVLVIH